METVRVARIITRLNIGGPARHAAILAKGLDSGQFKTKLITGVSPAVEGEILPGEGIDMVRIRGLRRVPTIAGDIAPFLQVRKELQSFRPHIVHTHTTNAGFIGRLAARSVGVPVIVHTYHGHALKDYVGRFRAFALRTMERVLARLTDVLISVSPEVRDDLVGMKIGRPEQHRVVRLGLELETLLNSELSKDAGRVRLGLPAQGHIVGIVGRLAPIKDHKTFLKVARLIIGRRDDVTFLIAGDGELRSALEAATSDITGQVRFAGWVTDLEALYASLDVVVLTSRNEGTPVALIEAMAAARPVVGTRVGGVADCVPSSAGVLCEAGDAESIAVAIESFLNDNAKTEESGAAGREWVRSRYGSARLVSEIEAIYKSQLMDSERFS